MQMPTFQMLCFIEYSATGPPQLVEAESVSSSSIRITWTAPLEEEQNGIIRSYYINVTEVPTGIVRESIAFG